MKSGWMDLIVSKRKLEEHNWCNWKWRDQNLNRNTWRIKIAIKPHYSRYNKVKNLQYMTVYDWMTVKK